MRRATSPIIEATGGVVKTAELNFVMRHAAMLFDQHGVLLEHTAMLSEAFFGGFERDLGSPLSLPSIVLRTKELLEQSKGNQNQALGAFAPVKRATLTPAKPIAVGVA